MLICKKQDQILRPYMKVKPNCIKDLNVRSQKKKFMTGLGNDFLDHTKSKRTSESNQNKAPPQARGITKRVRMSEVVVHASKLSM